MRSRNTLVIYHVYSAEFPMEYALATDLKTGIPNTDDDFASRVYAFGDNTKPPVIMKSKGSMLRFRYFSTVHGCSG